MTFTNPHIILMAAAMFFAALGFFIYAATGLIHVLIDYYSRGNEDQAKQWYQENKGR